MRRSTIAPRLVASLLFLFAVPFLRATCVADVEAVFSQSNTALLEYSYHGANNTPGFCGGVEIWSSWDGAAFQYTAGCGSCTDVQTATFPIYLSCISPGTHTIAINVYCSEHVGSSCVNDSGTDSTTFNVAHAVSIGAELGPRRQAGSPPTDGYDLATHTTWSDAQPSEIDLGWTYLPTRTWSGGGGPGFVLHPDAAGDRTDFVAEDTRGELVLVGAYACDLSAFNVVSIPKKDKECCDCKREKGTCVGAPIRVSNGNMHYADRDPIPPFPGGLQRDYDSSTPDTGYFGLGWTSILDDAWLRTRTEANGSTTVVVGTAENHRFVFNGSGSGFKQIWPLTSTPGAFVFDGTNYQLREYGSDTQTWFNTSGHPTKSKNIATGREITFTYTGSAPSAITDSWGNVPLTLSVNSTTGRIDSIAVGTAATWAYTYDSSGHLTAVTVDSLPWRTYTYSSNRLTEAHDAAGNLIESHAYDTNGLATTSVGGGREDISSISYGGSGRVTGEEVTSVTTAAGATTSYYTRYVAGRARTVEIAGSCSGCGVNDTVLGYDSNGLVVREQDARGYFTVRTFDSANREVSSSGPWKPSSCNPETDSAHCRVTPDTILGTSLTAVASTITQTTTYGDSAWPDRPTQIDVTSVSGSTHVKSDSYTYDATTGMVLTYTVSGYTGLPSLGTSESHTTTTTLYNGTEGAAFTPGGAFSSSWLTLAQPAGMRKSINGPRTDVTDVTTFVYYPFNSAVTAADRGHLAAVKNAAGHITRYENYDVFGNATKVVDPNGVASEATFDMLGRPVTSTLKPVSGCSTSADPLCGTDLTTSRAYSSTTGPLASQTDANTNVTTYEYDSRGRLTATSRGPSSSDLRERMEINYDTTSGLKTQDRTYAKESSSWVLKRSESYGYDTFARLTTTTHPDSTTVGYTYDAASNLKTVKDENHTSANTTYTYDPVGRMSGVAQTLGSGSISTSYAYDVQGNVVSVTDPNSNETTYVYDDYGRMLKQVSPVSGTTTYTYDLAENLVSTTDANAVITSSTYDDLNRRLSASSVRYSEDPEEITWVYDDSTAGVFGTGRLMSVTDPSGSTGYLYDRRGMLRQEEKTIDGNTYAVGYEYDANGNRTWTGDLHYTYDFANRESTVAQQTCSGSGCTTQIVTAATYLPFGPETEIVFANGLHQTRTYDARYRLQENKLATASSVTVANYTYGYDSAGNVTSIHDAVDSHWNRDFGYDDLSRLVTANSGSYLWGAGSYSYDGMGNVQSLSLGSTRTGSFSYSGTTPKLVTATENGTATAVTYDPTGNDVTSTPSGGITRGRVYSGRNLLAALVTGDPSGGTGLVQIVNYTYDGRGVRASQYLMVAGEPVRTDYLYTSELHLLARMDGGGQELDRFVWFAGHPVAQLSSTTPTLRYTFTDHLGTPILQTDGTQAIVWRAEYEPYGNVYQLRAGAADDQPLRLPGQELATTSPNGTEENYNIFRWYQGGWGRYTQADPVGLGFSKNLYSYAEQNPTGWVDTTGLEPYPPLPDCRGLACAACCVARRDWGQDANKHNFHYAHLYEIGATVAGAIVGLVMTRSAAGEVGGAIIGGFGTWAYLHHLEIAPTLRLGRNMSTVLKTVKH
jgi:RHS repeat-associated protein